MPVTSQLLEGLYLFDLDCRSDSPEAGKTSRLCSAPHCFDRIWDFFQLRWSCPTVCGGHLLGLPHFQLSWWSYYHGHCCRLWRYATAGPVRSLCLYFCSLTRLWVQALFRASLHPRLLSEQFWATALLCCWLRAWFFSSCNQGTTYDVLSQYLQTTGLVSLSWGFQSFYTMNWPYCHWHDSGLRVSVPRVFWFLFTSVQYQYGC